MKVKVIKITALTKLQSINQIKQDLICYSSGKFSPLTDDETSDTKVVLNDSVILYPSTEGKIIFENAIKLYEGLKNMDRISASDQRLWAWLAREPFGKYMAKRSHMFLRESPKADRGE